MRKFIKWLITPLIIDIVHDRYYTPSIPPNIARYWRIMDKRRRKADKKATK